ncbi:MAG TPA: DUF1491 family protein [Allosphingosinicella sp.]|nr:DUF1491 family protein [Allosphingosinicella sp.]
MEPRLSSSVLVSALMRQAEADGGFATVIARGDSDAGSVLVILSERGRKARFLERILQPDGRYRWQETGPQTAANDEEAANFLGRKRRFDPDLWVLELDIASAERFADEMNSFD